MKEKLHIVLSEASGVSSLDVSRQLPGLGLAGEIETVKHIEGKREVRDLLIARIEELEEASASADTAVVLLVGSRETVSEQRAVCVRKGILAVVREAFEVVFPAAAAMCIRLRAQRERESSLQRQLTDTKLVTRAKLLLMSRLQMSECEAHRYIEKTAMENGEPKRSVALRLIRTYEE